MIVEIGEVKLHLSDEQVEELRRQLSVETTGTEWLSADEVAKRLGSSRDWVYANALRLGGRKFSEGPKARWKFDPQRIEPAKPTGPEPKPEPKARKRRTRKAEKNRILAIRGEPPYAASTMKAAPGGAVTPAEGLTKGGLGSNGCERS